MSVRYPDSVAQCHFRIAKLENDIEVTQNALGVEEALRKKLSIMLEAARAENGMLINEREALYERIAEEINRS